MGDTRVTLPIPEETLAQHLVALGKTGSGKSSKLRVLVEHLLEHDMPVCILDPKGDWWGLKSSADGKRKGFPIVIFGGEHADVPLTAHSGVAVAELVATGNRSCLIDLGGWMIGDRTRFFIEFASALFKLARGARHLVIDEVHNFCPKGKIMDPDAGRMLHWANRLASEGRGKGIAILAASQRPQKVHNDFLTSCETLIAGRVLHKADRDAIKDWIDGCADPAIGKQMLADLPNMARTDAWCWSPEIKFGPHRITFPMFSTYDSFKPQLADTGKLKGWAEVDLEDVKAKLATAVEEAKANDPRALRARIAELERELKKPRELAIDTKSLEVAEEKGFTRGIAYGQNLANNVRVALLRMADANDTQLACMDSIRKQINGDDPGAKFVYEGSRTEPTKPAAVAHNPRRIHQPLSPRSAPAPRNGKGPSDGSSSDSFLKAMPRAFLTALAQHQKGLTKGQIRVHTGYRDSGPVSSCFAELDAMRYVEKRGALLFITAAGLEVLGHYEPLPTGADLRAHLLNGSKLSTMEKKLLEPLFEIYPEGLTKGRIRECAGYSDSGPVSSAFARLVNMGYAVKDRGGLRASDELFP